MFSEEFFRTCGAKPVLTVVREESWQWVLYKYVWTWSNFLLPLLPDRRTLQYCCVYFVLELLIESMWFSFIPTSFNLFILDASPSLLPSFTLYPIDTLNFIARWSLLQRLAANWLRTISLLLNETWPSKDSYWCCLYLVCYFIICSNPVSINYIFQELGSVSLVATTRIPVYRRVTEISYNYICKSFSCPINIVQEILIFSNCTVGRSINRQV